MRRALLVLPLALIFSGCMSASVATSEASAPAMASTAAPAAAEPTCTAQGAGSILEMSQSSMEPALGHGDRFLVVPGTPGAGDIVTFIAPETWFGGRSLFAKRVIGVGGDTIEVRDGAVYRNGVILDEPYLYRDAADGAQEPTEVMPDSSSWTIPAGQLFVMGDHRQKSADSRVFGPIAAGSVTGIVTWRCTPTPALLR